MQKEEKMENKKETLLSWITKQSKLLYMAWIVEILASFAGFGIAVSQYSVEGVTGFIQSGSIVFIIIAILELSKIPLLGVVYSTKSFFYRIFFIFIFIFSLLITFETFFVSMQMSYSKQLQSTKFHTKEKTMSMREAYLDLEKVSKDAVNIDIKQEDNSRIAQQQKNQTPTDTGLKSTRNERRSLEKSLRKERREIENRFKPDFKRINNEYNPTIKEKEKDLILPQVSNCILLREKLL